MAEADGVKKKKDKKKPPQQQAEPSGGDREGKNLLGFPTYTELSNGRFKCVETGHELPAGEIDSYGNSKRCRLGMIEFALKNKTPPLNMFKRDPNNSSKLVCKLTGDIVNKSEEHVWKHLNGKRFLNRLEQKEMGKLVSKGGKGKGDEVDEKLAGKENGASDDKKKKRKKKKKMKEKKRMQMEVNGEEKEEVEVLEKDTETEDIDFWVPPAGSRWDNDEGGDRWGSDSESEEDSVKDNGVGNEDDEVEDIDEVEDTDEVIEPAELFRSKRASGDNEHNSGSSRKKKKKTVMEEIH